MGEAIGPNDGDANTALKRVGAACLKVEDPFNAVVRAAAS
jgi:hypothetical protein